MNNAPWIDELHRMAEWLREHAGTFRFNDATTDEEDDILKANADRLDELADKLDEDKIVYVSAYEVTRQYGGAEEGGWWYNWLDLVETTPSLRRDADGVVETLKARHQHRAVGDIWSVLGGVEVSVIVEDESGENQSKERPHYE